MRKTKREMLIFILRFCVLAVSVFFIAAGIIKKEHLEVMQKAVKICLECIGIG